MATKPPKRVGWTVCPAVGGKYAVAAVLEGGKVGNGIVSFKTKDEAQQYIDSGQADEFERRIGQMKRRRHK